MGKQQGDSYGLGKMVKCYLQIFDHMVEVVNIRGHRLNKETLDLASSEYKDFRDSEGYEEEYKWEILEELNQWTNQNEINSENIQEFVELLQNRNPKTESLANYDNFQDVREYAETNPERLSKMLKQLYNEDQSLEERISSFRSELTLHTDSFAYLLAAYNLEKYPPFEQNVFIKFMKDFQDGESAEVTKMSVAEKYVLFTQYCNKLAEYLSKKGLDNSALIGQDFIHTTTSYSSVKFTYQIKYLYRFSKKMKSIEKEPEQIKSYLEDLPESFLKKQEDDYSDSEKIGEIRYRMVRSILEDKEVDKKQLKEEVNQKHDTNIVQNWRDFTIFSQIYFNYFKKRTERYLENISGDLRDGLGEEDLTSHIVSFQGAQSYPTTECWIAIYPASKESHRKAYRLQLSANSKGVRYGIASGNDIEKENAYAKEVFSEEKNIEYETIFQHLEDKLEELWELNEEEKGQRGELDRPKRFEEIKEQISETSQLVFYGPVGTGKTYTAQKFANYWVQTDDHGNEEERVETVTFHPSFSYEDFIEGLTAKKAGDSVAYEVKDGIFKEMAERAHEAYNEAEKKSQAPKYVLIIDEINRGNIPNILGETITLLEDDKRLGAENEVKVQLAHSEEGGKKFGIPPNLKIIGTMNTADRSVALVDTAIRRRFRFLRFPPEYELLIDNLGFEGRQELKDTIREDNDSDRVMTGLSLLALEELNQRIINSTNLGKGKQVGHSYLIGKNAEESIVDAWKYEILPLLEEYFFSQFQRMKTEIFNGREVSIIDWEKEEVKDFTSEELREAFENLVDIEDEE